MVLRNGDGRLVFDPRSFVLVGDGIISVRKGMV
jgi:hypothetical protein